jgi:hypothetical protein
VEGDPLEAGSSPALAVFWGGRRVRLGAPITSRGAEGPAIAMPRTIRADVHGAHHVPHRPDYRVRAIIASTVRVGASSLSGLPARAALRRARVVGLVAGMTGCRGIGE